ncbi:methylated-DNA--[protein]-cysteine S-methyltransferase [Quadrisphaera sp. DSM 44207]|uniref:methylated-DNA--[protein]-cysteine S-methyltransferase n=1 Tax=Quadrisphaera sp. DSM 44207 TaxID=1881057 RepID=UPI000883EFDB|nr:methylated-DNA--[protein]-cysteine S-methyltransferase [Quadrisphaera sp. DSM 44207]SDQ78273.1 methylated-DNA-[protein]-cysteine S-methyltransferase [Quadrisphaera sp. DSM 44207]
MTTTTITTVPTSAAPSDAPAAAALQVLRLPTPAGEVAVILTPEDGVVRAAGFCGPDVLAARLAPALSVRGLRPAPARGPVADALAAYADGDVDALDAVPVEQPGAPFLQEAWRALRGVRAGTTTSYTGLAAAAGRPAAVRAAGSACARNLVAPFVPCHRVLRSDGSLGGYLYGVDVKAALLRHEAR